MIVIADSGPLRYLVFIDQTHLLPLLYGGIVIPPSVVSELTQAATPHSVRIWMDNLPGWVTVKAPQNSKSVFPSDLGPGEREAIALVEELAADVLLVDDEAARLEASRRNIAVQGTLSILDLAAEHGFLGRLRYPMSLTPGDMGHPAAVPLHRRQGLVKGARHHGPPSILNVTSGTDYPEEQCAMA